MAAPAVPLNPRVYANKSKNAQEPGQIPDIWKMRRDERVEAERGEVRSQRRETMTHKKSTCGCHERSGARVQRAAAARSARALTMALRNSSSPASAGSTGLG